MIIYTLLNLSHGIFVKWRIVLKIRFGVMSGVDASIEETVQSVRKLERIGLDSAWFADHLVTLDRRDRCLDPWPIVATLASYTKRIRFGSMVTDPFRRHPAVFAQTLATIDWITGGRLDLGIGAGEAMNVAPFNIPWNHRAKRLEEFVQVLRMLWEDEAVNFAGDFFKLDRAFIQALPVQRGGVPIYIAANSPFTRKIAGRLGNGWIAEMMSPEMYRRDLKEFSRAVEEADRSISDIDIVYHVFCAISKDREEAKAQANGMVKMQFTWWPKQLERYGYKISNHCDWNHLVVGEDSFTESQKLSLAVPEKIADLVTISGNVDECIGKIEEYIAAGVTHFGFSIPDCKDETLEALGERVIPYFKKQ